MLPFAGARRPLLLSAVIGVALCAQAADETPAGDAKTPVGDAQTPAGEKETPAAETAPAPDKSIYNLFKPTPFKLMRDMDTDRPDKTNTPHTIDAGHVQFETSVVDYAHEHDTSGGQNVRIDTWAAAQNSNVRLGLLNNLEMNVSASPALFQASADRVTGKTSRLDGVGDTILGGKFNFFGNDGEDHPLKTAFGLQPQFKVPTAHGGLGNGHFEFGVGLPFLLDLPKDFQLGMQSTPGVERNSANTRRVLGWQNSVTLDHPLHKNLDAYVELWSDKTAEKHRVGQATFDAGVQYPITPNLLLDTGVNLGLNRQSQAVEWFLGVSFRH